MGRGSGMWMEVISSCRVPCRRCRNKGEGEVMSCKVRPVIARFRGCRIVSSETAASPVVASDDPEPVHLHICHQAWFERDLVRQMNWLRVSPDLVSRMQSWKPPVSCPGQSASTGCVECLACLQRSDSQYGVQGRGNQGLSVPDARRDLREGLEGPSGKGF